MLNTLSLLLPEILASVIYPAWILCTVLLLMGENGVKRIIALIAGGTLVRLFQILLFGFSDFWHSIPVHWHRRAY